MENSSITDSGVEQFVLCLQENNHLTKISIDENHVTPAVKQAVELVNQKRTLKNLPLLKIDTQYVDIMEEP